MSGAEGDGNPQPRLTTDTGTDPMTTAAEHPNTLNPSAPQGAVIADPPCATRRRLLTGLAGATLAFAAADAVAADHPDAELLAHCAQIEALQRRINGLWTHGLYPDAYICENYIADDDARNKAIDALEAEQAIVFDKMSDGEAVTLDGIQALARCLVLTDCTIRKSVVTDERVINHVSWEAETLLSRVLHALVGKTITDATCMDSPARRVTAAERDL